MTATDKPLQTTLRDEPAAKPKNYLSNALTFDLEAWFHAHNLGVPEDDWDHQPLRLDRPVAQILALLERHRTRATFFVLGWVAARIPGIVRDIHSAGHEIASHGLRHRAVTYQSPAEFREDVIRSKAVLEELAGCPVNGFRAPSYSIGPGTAWAFDVLAKAGFTYDSSVYPARALHGRYGWPGSPVTPYRLGPGLWEFPLPTIPWLGRRFPIATGAYLRLLPFSVTAHAIRWNMSRSIPVVVNIHPWELDPQQPRVRAARWRRTVHYTNLHTTERKLASLLERFCFVPLGELRKRYGEIIEGRPRSRTARELRPAALDYSRRTSSKSC